jgi:UDP-N-acetylmuramyl pentapeptide synthase
MSLLATLERYLGRSAQIVLKREQPLVISVSGSVGKSSTKQAVAAVLAAKDPAARARVSAKNYNNELGVPLTVFDCPAPGRSVAVWAKLLCRATGARLGIWRSGIRTFAFEMGIDKPGDFSYLLSLAAPQVAIVTGITPEDPTLVPAHVANFPNLEAYADEELRPVTQMPSAGTVILNADDQRLFAARHATSAHVMTVGDTEAADVRIVSTAVRAEEGTYGMVAVGLKVVLEVAHQQVRVFVPGVFGRPIAYALASAFALAQAVNIDLSVAQERLEQGLEPMRGRTRLIPGIKHTTLLDDTYNSSVPATISALRDLAELTLAPGQRRVACLGEMREIGPQAELMHRRVGQEAARRNIDLLVCCGTFAHAMADGARASGLPEERVKVIEDTPEAGRFLQAWIKPGDVVLAKASEGGRDAKGLLPTGVRMERVIKELMAEPLRASELLVRQEPTWDRK